MGQIAFTIESTLENASLAGMSISKICSNVFSESDAAGVEVAVVEAITNVVEHSYQLQPGKKIEVTIYVTRDRFDVEIKDHGQSIDARRLDAINDGIFRFEPTDLDSIPEKGMGLALIKKAMDEVTYSTDSGVNCMRLVKYIRE